VVISGVRGTAAANGRWAISLIDSTHFTLNGSTFTGAYTSGGSVWLGPMRRGSAYEFRNGTYFGRGNVSFGWDNAFIYDTGSIETSCRDCWADYWINQDPVPIGVQTKGTSSHAHWSGFINYPQTAIMVNGTTGDDILYVIDSHVSGLTPNTIGSPVIAVDHGTLQISGGYVEMADASAKWLYIADSASQVSLSNTFVNQGSISFQSSVNCSKFIHNGVTGPCTAAALPVCDAGKIGARIPVSDATAPTYNGTLTGGGAVPILAICDGSNWRAH
jgi:hypothetical protein